MGVWTDYPPGFLVVWKDSFRHFVWLHKLCVWPSEQFAKLSWHTAICLCGCPGGLSGRLAGSSRSFEFYTFPKIYHETGMDLNRIWTCISTCEDQPFDHQKTYQLNHLRMSTSPYLIPGNPRSAYLMQHINTTVKIFSAYDVIFPAYNERFL